MRAFRQVRDGLPLDLDSLGDGGIGLPDRPGSGPVVSVKKRPARLAWGIRREVERQMGGRPLLQDRVAHRLASIHNPLFRIVTTQAAPHTANAKNGYADAGGPAIND